MAVATIASVTMSKVQVTVKVTVKGDGASVAASPPKTFLEKQRPLGASRCR